MENSIVAQLGAASPEETIVKALEEIVEEAASVEGNEDGEGGRRERVGMEARRRRAWNGCGAVKNASAVREACSLSAAALSGFVSLHDHPALRS